MPRTHGRICWPRQPRAANLRLPIKAESAVALALLGEHAAALAAADEAVPLLLGARDVEVQA